MKQENIEMLNDLRKFVTEIVRKPNEATPAQLEAMTEAATLVLKYS